MRLATVDVGTNSILLLVAERRDDGTLVPIDERCRIERLGRGVDERGVLDPAAVAGSLDALREYRAAIDASGATRVAAVGTQALREAGDGASFLGPAAEILGVPVEVIDGQREAALAFAAVAHAFPELGAGDVVVCDVGGGSTELIVGRGGRLVRAVSVPLGSVRLTERFLPSDPPEPARAAAMIAAIDEVLAPLDLPAGAPLVGTAGTVTSLAAVALRLWPYHAERVQGFRLVLGEVERQLARYLESTDAGRRRMVGLDPKRADVIAAGAAIVARVMHRVGEDVIIVSDRGVRWGLAYELAGT